MLGQENYLEGSECNKNILVHPNLDIAGLIELYRRQDAEVVKWLKVNEIQVVQSIVYQSISGNCLKAQNIG